MPSVQFYFAWVDPGTEFDPDVHNVEDENVFSFTLAQVEGDFASLECIIKNPRIGFLNPGRKIWAWFSKSVDGAEAEPMFFGRLLGIPTNVFDTLVTINMTARPQDFVAQKTELAESLKVAPFWDDIFIKSDAWDDPDSVLEGYTGLWNIDPITHLVTLSDILVPEDGVVVFGPSDFFYDSMSITLNQVPLRSIQIDAAIPWTQDATGLVDISKNFGENWPGSVASGTSLVSSFTFKGLLSSWPQPGARMGSGWTARLSELKDLSYTNKPPFVIPYYYDTSNIPALPEGSIMYPERIQPGSKYWGGVDGAGFDTSVTAVFAPIGWGLPKLVLQYTASRKFVETVRIVLKTAQQAIATMAEDDEALLLKITANEVTDLDENGNIPLGDTLKRSFVDTARGKQAVEHLICIARANLAMRSRAVLTEFQTDMLSGLTVTLRKGVQISDPRIPGGVAVGKCVGYSHSLDGQSGAAISIIRFASTVGYGGSYVASEGDPTYCEADYVGSDYQEYENEVILVGTEDVTWTPPPIAYFDDGLDFQRGFTRFSIIRSLFVENGPVEQRAAIIGDPAADTAGIQSKLQNLPTRVHLDLIAMEGGPFLGTKEITVSDLIIPKQIDLEAASVGP